MECRDSASPDMKRSEDLPLNAELHADCCGPDADESEDADMKMSESSSVEEQTITTFTTDSSYVVTWTVSIALAVFKGIAMVLFLFVIMI